MAPNVSHGKNVTPDVSHGKNVTPGMSLGKNVTPGSYTSHDPKKYTNLALQQKVPSHLGDCGVLAARVFEDDE